MVENTGKQRSNEEQKLEPQRNIEDERLSRYRRLSFVYVVISFFGLCLLVFLAFNIPASSTSIAFRKLLTFSGFGVICILGATVGVSPSKCSQVRHFGTLSESASEESRRNSEEKAISLRGHHPTCGNFSSHVLQFSGKTYCAGCIGLVAGAIASLLGVLLYLLVDFNAGEAGKLVFWMGFIGVACGLLQYELPVSEETVHFLLNAVFVFAVFLLLIGISEINSINLDVYFLALTIYWIIARIMMSRLEHRKICANCGSKSCSYSFN